MIFLRLFVNAGLAGRAPGVIGGRHRPSERRAACDPGGWRPKNSKRFGNRIVDRTRLLALNVRDFRETA
jgi:hypothetical protein